MIKIDINGVIRELSEEEIENYFGEAREERSEDDDVQP